MATKIFPTVNDVAPTAGDGKTLSEANLLAWLKVLLARNFVASGFTLPASSANLYLSIAAGEANIAGARVVTDAAETVTCTANATNHIYLKLTKDAGGKISGAVFEVNTTGVAPADSVLIGTAVADADNVTSTTDSRPLHPFDGSQLPDASVALVKLAETVIRRGANDQAVEPVQAFLASIDTRPWVVTSKNAAGKPLTIEIRDGATVVATITYAYAADNKTVTQQDLTFTVNGTPRTFRTTPSYDVDGHWSGWTRQEVI